MKLHYADVETLYLDPRNPRLGRENSSKQLPPGKILELMQDWELDELATSFIESGFWPQEALIVVKEKIGGREQLVAAEGNRRLAALKLLAKPPAASKKWQELAKEAKSHKTLLTEIPYFVADSRDDIASYLGFRHVTGIKEWHPAEKAEFIAKLVEEGASYEDVRRRIGSKAPTVRQHYVAYRLLLQMEGREDIEVSKVEEKFSVLYLSLRTEGVRQYLAIDIELPPGKVKQPVPKKHLKNLANFSRWLFGDDENAPVLPDSRKIDEFGKVLESPIALKYLEETPKPSFDYARRLSGSEEGSAISLVRSAAESAAEALRLAHLFPNSKDLGRECKLLLQHAQQLVKAVTPSEEHA
jgi:hypothetical protein